MPAALLSWWNLIFVLPFALGALLVVFSLLSLAGGHSAHGAHGHASHGHSGHAATHTHASHHTHPHANRSPARHEHPNGQKASLPPLLWLQNLLLCWGALGYGCNLALGLNRFHPQSLWVAGVAGLIIAIALGNVLLRIAPTEGSAAIGKSALEGCIGESVSPIGEHGGEVLVRDSYGTLHHITAHSETPVARGVQVLVIEWDETTDRYLVRAWKIQSAAGSVEEKTHERE